MEEDDQDDGLPELQRDLQETAKRLSMGLHANGADADHAIGILLVQTRLKLPVFARDASRRLVEELSARLRDCGDNLDRRDRIVVILGNAVQVEENARAMAASPTLLMALVDDLRQRPAREEPSLVTRQLEIVVVEAILSKGARVTNVAQADALVAVLARELRSRDVRRPAALSALARLVRDGDHLALLTSSLSLPLLDDIVRLLGDALLVQSSNVGSEDGLLELESSLEILYQCAGDESLAERVAGLPMVIHHLMMLLMSTLDPMMPRHYLAFLRKAVNVLMSLAAGQAEVREELLASHLSDLLLVVASKTPVSSEVVPLLDLLREDDNEDEEGPQEGEGEEQQQTGNKE